MHYLSQLDDVTSDTKRHLLPVLRHRYLSRLPPRIGHVTLRTVLTPHTPTSSTAAILNSMETQSAQQDRVSRLDTCLIKTVTSTDDVTPLNTVTRRPQRRPFSDLQPVATDCQTRATITPNGLATSFDTNNFLTANQHRRSVSRDIVMGVTNTIRDCMLPLRDIRVSTTGTEDDDVIVNDDNTMWRPWW